MCMHTCLYFIWKNFKVQCHEQIYVFYYIKNCELYCWNSSYKSFEKKNNQPNPKVTYIKYMSWMLKNDLYTIKTIYTTTTHGLKTRPAAPEQPVYFMFILIKLQIINQWK